ncbi:Hint domain-containing protein, partial [Acetobacter indonesiensis]|uniref:Hint domain-containing protein n=1 Tax=Acetobacter indonesiensis TaxID=104101 RepID=UPI0039BF39B8
AVDTSEVPTAGNANIIVNSGATLSSVVLQSGNTLTVNSGGTIPGLTTIQDGGSATIWNNAGGTIDLSGDKNNGLTISGLENGGTVNTVISGWSGSGPGNSDSIDLAGVSAAGASYDYPSNDQVVITLANGKTITLNIANVKNKGFVLVDDGNGGALAEVCFLGGSMIQTPDGDVAVEDLRLGDTVLSYVCGIPQTTPVTWVGKAHCVVRPHLRDDEAGYPVRILKDAVSEGVPYKDLLVTPEHCLFFDGRFVPVRMLVNGSSIFYDKSFTSYDYYHVETQQHAVIRADGMLTESYLDTGNRKAFRQEGTLVALHGSNKTWEKNAAAPLCVERDFVEPLFHSLVDRAHIQGHATPPVSQGDTTNDPDLHLVTATGGLVRPVRREDSLYTFMLPPDTKSVRIVSRTSRQVDIIGPFVDDRRDLGVAVGSLQLLTAHTKNNILHTLKTDRPEGWHVEAEDSQALWTNGNALLPLDEYVRQGTMCLLSLSLCAAGPYLIDPEQTEERKAHSA